MSFFFDKNMADVLMSKINLRQITLRSKQWDHPVKGLFKFAESMQKNRNNILDLPKKDREQYCISLFALAMMSDSKQDWWVSTQAEEPPDGTIMMLRDKDTKRYIINLREIEVVEYRNETDEIFDIIKDKMIEKSYEPNTVLVCMVLVPGVYDFMDLSLKLKTVTSSINHVFVVFAGITLNDHTESSNIKNKFTLVQLLPIINNETFDYNTYLDDFKNKYDKGRESRIIENNQIHYGTANKNI